MRGNRVKHAYLNIIKTNSHYRQRGFALPTILIASLIMLSVLLVSVASTVAVRAALANQYYGKLSKNASDSGLAYAKECLSQNDGVPKWSDVKPLKPNTDCTGTQLAGFTCSDDSVNELCWVASNSNLRSTFTVGMPSMIAGKASRVVSIGKTELLSLSGLPWRRYTNSSQMLFNIINSSEFGTGSDGDIVIAADKNINIDKIAAGRITANCADGVKYAVASLTASSATLTAPPPAGCLAVDDEVLIMNLQGTPTYYVNVGNYETLRVLSVVGSVVNFKTNKTKYYGNGSSDDTNIGSTVNGSQRVMLQRVPNYNNVTINATKTLTADAWNRTSGVGGVLFIKASGTVSVVGSVTMNGKGYGGGPGQSYGVLTPGGESSNGIGGSGGIGSPVGNGTTLQGGGGGGGTRIGVFGTGASGSIGMAGGGGGSCYGGTNVWGYGGNGGGGGNGTVGLGGGLLTNDPSNASPGSGIYGGNGKTSTTVSYGANGGGGGSDGLSDSSGLQNRLFMGGGGGGGGSGSYNSSINGTSGGASGGIIIIMARSIIQTGTIYNNGAAGVAIVTSQQGGGGGGSGGSILLKASENFTNNGMTTTTGGAGASMMGIGGDGRIAIYANKIYGSGTTNPVAYKKIEQTTSANADYFEF